MNAALNLTKINEVAAAVSQLVGAIISDFENSKMHSQKLENISKIHLARIGLEMRPIRLSSD